MEVFLKYLPEQPMWVLVVLGALGILGYLSRHIREILEVVSFKKTRALEAKVEMTADLKWLGQHGESHVATVEVPILNIRSGSPLHRQVGILGESHFRRKKPRACLQ